MSHITSRDLGLRINANTSLDKIQEFLSNKGDGDKLYGKKVGDETILYIKPKTEGFLGTLANAWRNFRGLNERRVDDARNGIIAAITNAASRLQEGPNAGIRGFGSMFNLLSAPLHDDSRPINLGNLKRDLGVMLKVEAELYENYASEYKKKMDNVFESIGGKTLQNPESREFTVDNRPRNIPVLTIEGERFEPKRILGLGGNAVVFQYESNGRSVAVKIPREELIHKEADYEILKNIAKEINIQSEATEKLGDKAVNLIDVFKTDGYGVIIVVDYMAGGEASGLVEKLNKKVGDQGEDGALTKTDAKNAVRMVVKDIGESLDQLHRIGKAGHLDVKGENALVDEDGVSHLSDFGSSAPSGLVQRSDILVPESPYFSAPELQKLDRMDKDKGVDSIREEKLNEKLQAKREKFVEDTQKFTDQYDIATDFEGNLDNIFNQVETSERIRSRTEIINAPGIKVDSTKADVWSFGAMVYNMMTDKVLMEDIHDPNQKLSKDHQNYGRFEKMYHKQVLIDFTKEPNPVDGGELGVPHDPNVILEKKERPKAIGDIATGSLANSTGDPELDDFLNFILQPDPKDRPTMQQILSHDFMTKNQEGYTRGREVLKGMVNGTI